MLQDVISSLTCVASAASRISFGVSLLRLTTGWWRRFVWFIIVVLFLTMVPAAVSSWMKCAQETRVSDNSPGPCWDHSALQAYVIFHSASNSMLDVALALIPWKLIWGLPLKTKEKIGVSIGMSLGIL
jgi:hypothetical protein